MRALATESAPHSDKEISGAMTRPCDACHACLGQERHARSHYEERLLLCRTDMSRDALPA